MDKTKRGKATVNVYMTLSEQQQRVLDSRWTAWVESVRREQEARSTLNDLAIVLGGDGAKIKEVDGHAVIELPAPTTNSQED